MKKKAFILLITVGIFSICKLNASAQEHGHDAENSSEHHSKHHLAYFIGAASNFTHEYTAFVLGIDYEYRFHKSFGIGVLSEFVFSDPNELLLGMPVFHHPYKGLKILVAPMMSVVREELVLRDQYEFEIEYLTRLGVGYDFHLNGLSLTPSLEFDFGNTSTLVFGLAIGHGL